LNRKFILAFIRSYYYFVMGKFVIFMILTFFMMKILFIFTSIFIKN
jgi:hypothetical protein